MTPQLLLFVALGGAIGSVGRFATMSVVGYYTQAWGWSVFPWGSLVVNVLGAFALGAVIEISALVWSPSEEIRAMVVVGMMGAFTTFSAFSMDLYYLLDRGQMVSAGLYAAGSVLVCLLAFGAAMSVMRMILS